MADGTIAEWLDAAGPEGAPASAGPGTDAGPPDETTSWRPDVERADREERSRRLWRGAGLLWGVVVALGAVLLLAGRLVGSPPAPEDVAGPPAPGDPAAEERGPVPRVEAEAEAEAEDADARAAGAPAPTDEAADAATGTQPAVEGAGPPQPPGAAWADGDGALGAHAAVAVRLAVTADDDPARYVDQVHPERVERHGDVAVVTLVAVVLEGRDGRWEAVRPARYGVAVRTGEDGPAVIGQPWPLPPPAAPVGDPAPAADPLDDPAVAAEAEAALAAAGWRDVGDLGAVAGAAPPLLRLHVTAVAPGEQEVRAHEVWLLEGDGLHVAGLPR